MTSWSTNWDRRWNGGEGCHLIDGTSLVIRGSCPIYFDSARRDKWYREEAYKVVGYLDESFKVHYMTPWDYENVELRTQKFGEFPEYFKDPPTWAKAGKPTKGASK